MRGFCAIAALLTAAALALVIANELAAGPDPRCPLCGTPHVEAVKMPIPNSDDLNWSVYCHSCDVHSLYTVWRDHGR